MNTTQNVPVGESDATGAVEWGALDNLFTGEGSSSEGDESATEAAPADSESEATDTEPQVKEFRYKGRTLKVSPEDYDVLDDLLRQARGENGRLGGENAQLRERLARLEGMLETTIVTPPKKEEGPRQPPPELALDDFPAWQQQHEAWLEWKLEQKAQAARADYENRAAEERKQAEKAQEAAHNAGLFYQENTHLDHDAFKRTVAEVWVDHAKELGQLRTKEERDRLAQLADARIAAIRSAGGRSAKPRPPQLEGSAVAPPKTTVTAPVSDQPYSAADFVRAARARMRGAQA